MNNPFQVEAGLFTVWGDRELSCLRPEQEAAESCEQNILQAAHCCWTPVPLTCLTSGHSEG